MGGVRRGRATRAAIGGALGLVVLLSTATPFAGDRATTGPVVHAPNAAAPLAAPKGPRPVAATVALGPYVGNVSPEFWATVAQTTASRGILTDPNIGAFLNATPFGWFTYSELSDQCDVPLNVYYLNNGSTVSPCQYNISAFASWCQSRSAGCHAILYLPGEINNSSEDAAVASYIVNTLGFQPDYWAIGNEPELWTHYGIAWPNWKTTDHSAPTPLAYAFDVHAAIAAVKAVDPVAKFIGIEADCVCGNGWFRDVVKLNGPNLSAIALHSYPSLSQYPSETIGKFYQALIGKGNLTTGYSEVQSAIASACPTCGPIPILITEYNSGPGYIPSVWSGTYANAVFLAASTIQALRVNLTMFSIFNVQSASGNFNWSMMNDTDAIAPEGVLYEDLMPHLDAGRIDAVNVSTTMANVWGVLTVGKSNETLLVADANPTKAIALNLSALFPKGAPAMEYLWSPTTISPVGTSVKLQGPVDIPSQGILLLEVP